jgi:hypothetical protein
MKKLLTEVHNMIAADGTVVDNNIPGPKSNLNPTESKPVSLAGEVKFLGQQVQNQGQNLN